MIRIAEETDVRDMLSIYGPYILETTHTFEYVVPTYEEFLERFRRITRRFPWLVWEEDGQILGYAYGSAPFERDAYRWSCECSVYLRPQAHRRGIGRKLYTALEAIMAYQGHRMCYTIVTSENHGSLAFHQKLGYKIAAEMPNCGRKFGKWLGIIWMEKELAFVANPPGFPVEWQAIRQDEQKFSDILDILSLSQI